MRLLRPKMLPGVHLPQASCPQVLDNTSGMHETKRIDCCLRNTFGRYHESERKPPCRDPRDQRDQRGPYQPRKDLEALAGSVMVESSLDHDGLLRKNTP